jgi:hypothetical protein
VIFMLRPLLPQERLQCAQWTAGLRTSLDVTANRESPAADGTRNPTVQFVTISVVKLVVYVGNERLSILQVEKLHN